MEYKAIIAGTGFEGRAPRIRAFAKPGMPVILKREADNAHDPNAIAVYLPVRKWYTLFREVPVQIGYIKRSRAATLVKRTGQGGKIISARIDSIDIWGNHPRVSLVIITDW